MYFILDMATNDQYYFKIKADNHKTLCHSETYHNRQDALNAISIIKDEAEEASTIDKTK